MKVFAISDFHLSFLEKFNKEDLSCTKIHKPMDIFGQSWNAHYRKIYDNWQKNVSLEDAVLVAGDISWAMKLSETSFDFDFLSQLPGKILISKGNHDYWWQGISNVRAALPENVFALNHDSAVIGNKAICATRGWILPDNKNFNKEDKKIYNRELLRLEMALIDAKKYELPIVVMMHFMPINYDGSKSDFIDMMNKYNVETCVYGHLHSDDCKRAINGNHFGIEFFNTSCDCIDFEPIFLWQE